MRRLSLLLACSLFALPAMSEDAKMTGPLAFKMKGIDGKEVDLASFKGKVVLFVNVASKCGFTSQYEGLQKLYETNKDKGLVVIGVPANEFNKQEPGTDEQIAEFCSSEYRVTFPMMSKVVVKGDNIAPLYAFLTGKDTDPKFAGPIGWNFEKFLVGRDGQVVGRYKSAVKPDSKELTEAIETELAKK